MKNFWTNGRTEFAVCIFIPIKSSGGTLQILLERYQEMTGLLVEIIVTWNTSRPRESLSAMVWSLLLTIYRYGLSPHSQIDIIAGRMISTLFTLFELPRFCLSASWSNEQEKTHWKFWLGNNISRSSHKLCCKRSALLILSFRWDIRIPRCPFHMMSNYSWSLPHSLTGKAMLWMLYKYDLMRYVWERWPLGIMLTRSDSLILTSPSTLPQLDLHGYLADFEQ